MTGPRAIDQMVDAAMGMISLGDRAGAEELIAQVLRIDPSHAGAQHAVRILEGQTQPGLTRETQPSLTPLASSSVEGGPDQTADESVNDDTLPPRRDLPFQTTPSAIHHAMHDDPSMPSDDTPVPPEGARPPDPVTTPAQPAVTRGLETTRITEVAALPRQWSLEVLTGPRAGTSIVIAKRPILIGRGLGALDVEDDPFISPGHASFFQRGPDLWVSDGGGVSGTWVTIEGTHRLSAGDGFSVGLQRFTYQGPLDESPGTKPLQYGAPRPLGSWILDQILVGNRTGSTWLFQHPLTIGRSGHLAFPEDASLAPVHAELIPSGAFVDLVDRGGQGTFVALGSGHERRVPAGCRVRLGSTVLRVSAR